MLSNAHARKRGLRSREPDALSSESNDSANAKETKWRHISKMVPSTRRILVMLAILLGGLLVAHLVAKHRKAMLHVLSESGLARNDKESSHSHSPRFVTVVDSGSEVNPAGRHQRLESIHATWGPSARGIFVVNNVSECPEIRHSIKDSSQSYPQLLLLPPSVLPDRSIPALQYTIRSILEHVDPDFCLFTNDHTYVLPDHLERFLEHRSPSQHMYAGHALKVGEQAFNPASSGYVLSRTTMQKLVQRWDDKDPICMKEKSHAGFFVSRCLGSLNVTTEDTRQDGKFHQFHAYPIMRLVTGKVDPWYLDLSQYENLFGKQCCSKNTVTFHYIESYESRALFATRNALLENPHMTNDALKTIMIQQWPQDVGGYSHALPDPNSELWETILYVMRKISA